MRKLYKLLNILIPFILISCQYNNQFLQEIEIVEFEDDNLCMMEGVNVKNSNTLALYWKCRLRVINQRLENDKSTYGYNLIYKSKLKKLQKKIKQKIKEENENSLIEIENSLNEKEHEYCIVEENKNNLSYYQCRQNLFDKRKNQDKLLAINNDNYIKNNIKEEIPEDYNKKESVLVDKKCIKYLYDEKKLNKCIENINNFNICINNIKDQIEQRRLDDKIYCNQSSISKYPDSLFNNINNDTSMMIGPSMNKNNLLKLRNNAYAECYKNRMIKIKEYRLYLENKCLVENFANLQ